MYVVRRDELIISQRYAEKKFRALGGAAWDELEIDAAGWGNFTCPLGKVQIWAPWK